MVEIAVEVNGRAETAEVDGRMLLSDFLRGMLGLTGTHVGCEHGYCGSCTVLVDGASARSCLMLAAQANGSSVRTVEGLADGEELSSIQQAFKDCHGLQCGFCTPGLLMTVTEIAAEVASTPSRHQIREQLAGNLCRCTGYHQIVDAVEQALEQATGGGR
ncbi:(2Fe-2S)-binding protein [Candidatus Poriferisocius sp.]|uniref:(2Fe-2S)-binding protein n=1 Tax=Candidatus Poriferisocius sp. TaxID=3101276 RepID=UPI003B5C5CBC